MKSALTIHCVVKNEEKWVWFAIKSIEDIASKIIIYDTGSTDKTVEIIKSIKSKKIIFEEKGPVDAKGLVKLRREQLFKTKTEWFMILDGDEIWPEKTKKELIKKIKSAKEKDWGAVVRAWNFVGDVFHYHPESVKYHWPFAPKSWHGWANLRVIRNSISGLKIIGEYPLEAYVDNRGIPLQNYGTKHLLFFKNRYFHASYLVRSDSRKKDKTILNRTKKSKMEFGRSFPDAFRLPEVFYLEKPSIVADPFARRTRAESFISILQTPAKEVRRKILNLYNPK